MGRKKTTDRDAIRHLAHDVLILHLFQLFNRIEEQRDLGQVRRKTNEAAGLASIDPRTLESATKGHSISPKSANKIADALSKKLHKLIDESGGPEKLLAELKSSLEWSDPTRAFQWLEDRIILRKPPYIHQGDIIVNRNDRHLIDDFRISLAVAPCPNGMMEIEYPDRSSKWFACQSMAFLQYIAKFSSHNRNYQSNIVLRYCTNDGMLELTEPTADELRDPANYRRNRKEASFTPNPRSSENQRLSMLIYGGYDDGEERAHFSFLQNALYRRVAFTLDLSAYPDGSVSVPRLFVVCKLPGRSFDCCAMNALKEGQTIQPDKNQCFGQRRTWNFESFEQMMIGVHWTVDKSKIPMGFTVSKETLLGLFPEPGANTPPRRDASISLDSPP